VTGSNGSIDGELIADSVTSSTAQFESESGDIFSGNLGSTATPEPATFAGMASALLALAAVRRAQR
jgi:hypothetical protein